MSDTELLTGLAAALAEAGWVSQRRYFEIIPRLRVWHPSMPGVGETVNVVSGPIRPCFVDGGGALLARCADLPGAVAAVAQLLGPYVQVHT